MSLFLQKLLTFVNFCPFLREHNFENSEIFAKNREKKKKEFFSSTTRVGVSSGSLTSVKSWERKVAKRIKLFGMTEREHPLVCSVDGLLDAKGTSLSENDDDTGANGDETRIQAGASGPLNKRRYIYALHRCRVCLM